MTFFQWILNNQTKLLGGLTVILSTLVSAAAAGQLDGMIAPTAIKWLGLANIIVGALTGRAGFANTTKERVAASNAEVAVAKADTATAMKTAIEATPGGN